MVPPFSSAIMIKITFHIIVFACLFSCGADVELESNSDGFNKIEYSVIDPVTSEMNNFFYNGNRIEIEFVENQNLKNEDEHEVFTIQKIEQKIDDLTFRAKRIPKKLYLLNKGIAENKLDEALSEIKDEQLFYFEFEDGQKLDLMKKYFEGDMDRSVAYLSFDIFQDFHIVDKTGATIHAEYVLYERTFHVSPFEKILVGFTNVNEEEELKLVYNDKLFGKGISEFSFAPTTTIKNTFKQPL